MSRNTTASNTSKNIFHKRNLSAACVPNNPKIKSKETAVTQLNFHSQANSSALGKPKKPHFVTPNLSPKTRYQFDRKLQKSMVIMHHRPQTSLIIDQAGKGNKRADNMTQSG